MRHLINLLFVAITFPATGQILEEFEKIQLFRTTDGRLHSRRFADSIQYDANNFGRRTKFKETKDSVYYDLKYFPKFEFPDRYLKEGSFCGNSKRKKLDEIKKLPAFKETTSIRLVSFKRLDNGEGKEIIEREIPKTVS